jgi:hypothetical protein
MIVEVVVDLDAVAREEVTTKYIEDRIGGFLIDHLEWLTGPNSKHYRIDIKDLDVGPVERGEPYD